MKMKLFNKVRKSFEIAGITLVMTILYVGLANNGAVAFAAEYYYDKYFLEGKPDRTGDYEQTDGGYELLYNDERSEIWVNDNGVIRAIVVNYFKQEKGNNNLWIGHYDRHPMYNQITTYAQNAFVRDGLIEKGGDYIYYCDINRARTTGLGVVHGKYILLCPDMSKDTWGHIMEKGEVWNGVEIETTGQLFFGRDAILTQDCLNKLAAVGIDILNPIKMTNRIYARRTVYRNKFDYKAPKYVPSKYDYSYEETLARQGWAFNFPSQTGKEEADEKERTQNYINYFEEGPDYLGYHFTPSKIDYPTFLGEYFKDDSSYDYCAFDNNFDVYDDNVRWFINSNNMTYEEAFNNSPYIEDEYLGDDYFVNGIEEAGNVNWYYFEKDFEILDHHL